MGNLELLVSLVRELVVGKGELPALTTTREVFAVVDDFLERQSTIYYLGEGCVVVEASVYWKNREDKTKKGEEGD